MSRTNKNKVHSDQSLCDHSIKPAGGVGEGEGCRGDREQSKNFKDSELKMRQCFYSLASGGGAEVSSEGSHRLCDPANVQAANRG